MATLLSCNVQNIQGCRTKLKDLKLSYDGCPYDITFVTESWLNDTIMDHEFIDTGMYSLFRRDRIATCSKKSDGGGIFIAVKNKYSPIALEEFHSDAEDIWALLTVGNFKLYLCCVYLPHNEDVNYTCFLTKLKLNLHKVKDHSVIICGDFNYSTVDWLENKSHFEPFNVPPKYSELLETFTDNGLMQFNNIYNVNNRLLDLVFCNNFYISNLSQSDHPLLPENIDHPSLEFLFECPDRNLKQKDKLKYSRNFKQINCGNINTELSSFDWSSLLVSENINENANVFYEIVNTTIQNNIPLKKINNKFPSYFSHDTIKLILKKNKIHKKWKVSKNQNDYNIFKLIRSQAKQCINNDYQSYVSDIEDEIPNNSKRFWHFVSNKKSNIGTPKEMRFGDRVAADGAAVCGMFSDFFQSVYVPGSPTGKAKNKKHFLDKNKSLSTITLTDTEVRKALEGLDEKKGAGSDEIPAIFAKRCSVSLYLPLRLLYNHSLSSGIFPDAWKISAITPIYKNGKKMMLKIIDPSVNCAPFQSFLRNWYTHIFLVL